jgi:hypothetical protein
MSRNQKLFWMFAPLALFLVLLGVAIDDMKHPVLTEDRCQVVGTGESLSQLKATSPMLYRQSDSDRYDIGLSCQKRGMVMINDHEPFEQAVALGAPVTLTEKAHRYLPTFWRLEVETNDPNAADISVQSPAPPPADQP